MEFGKTDAILSITSSSKFFANVKVVGPMASLLLTIANEGISDPFSRPAELSRLEYIPVRDIKVISLLVLRSELPNLWDRFCAHIVSSGITIRAKELRMRDGQDNLGWIDVELNGVRVRLQLMPLGKKTERLVDGITCDPRKLVKARSYQERMDAFGHLNDTRMDKKWFERAFSEWQKLSVK